MSILPSGSARLYPPVVLAPTDELVAAFRASRARPAMTMATEFLRQARPVTDEGVMEEPDVDALGGQLDELLDGGGRDAVYVVAGWAAAAGFVTSEDGELRRADAADGLAGTDDEQLTAAIALFTGIRALVYTEALGRWLGAAANPSLFDGVLRLLLRAGDAGAERRELVDEAWHVLVAEVAMGAQARGGRKEVRADIAAETDWLVELLADLGAATPEGDGVRLTPLGTWLLREQLGRNGVALPVVGELADAPVGQLLASVAGYPADAGISELDAWVAGHADIAGRDLARHAGGTDDPLERDLALAALDRMGPEAEAEVRTLLDEPLCRPWALAWLTGRDLADLGTLAPADARAATVEQLAVALARDGARGVAAALGEGRDTAAQVALVETLWRVDSPFTGPVLDALGTASGDVDKAVAKAARKARFKRTSAAR